MHRCQEIVLLHTQHIVRQRHTRSHQFCDASLHQLLCQLRVFQLVTNRHTFTRPNEFRQIRIQRMIREPRHRRTTCRRTSHTAAFCQRDTQDVSRHTCILIVCFIEVATTKQQQSIGMLRLKIIKLPHHWRQLFFLCHKVFKTVFTKVSCLLKNIVLTRHCLHLLLRHKHRNCHQKRLEASS